MTELIIALGVKLSHEIEQEVQEYFLSKDWVGSKWRPVFKVWEQVHDKHSKMMQNSYT